ncbi:MAG: ABC transporter permease [Clostridia bacterium]|nr:ABC transporter permease [Clostridia bacterium]
MMGKLHGLKEPRFHISRRYDCPAWKRWAIRIIAIVLALLINAAVINALTGLNALDVYKTIIDGAVGSNRKLWATIRDTMILLCISVAITPAFRMRFWNVGAEGQTLIGGLATAAIMINLAPLVPEWFLILLMLLAAVLAGALWGLIPAVFKAQWNTNETLFTLMMNYIATQLTAFAIIYWENPAGSNTVGVINQATNSGWFRPLFGLQYGLNVVIVLAVTAAVYFYLRSTKHGYEIAYVGQSINTARYAGISVKHVIGRTMALSGGLCGLAGFILVSGTGHTISTGIVGGRGFTAIVVAWLSKLNTFTMVLVSFLLVFMGKGASQTASKFNLNETASDIILGIILFFVLGCEFFINFRITIRSRERSVQA